MPTTTLNDAEIYYETRGDPEDPAIFALHGGPGIGDGRKPLGAFESLAEDYYLVVPDHRGCGRSEIEPPFTNEQFAADVEALRQQLDIENFVLLGGSYGGFISQSYAIRYGNAADDDATSDSAETETGLQGLLFRDTAATPEYDIAARETARERLPEVRERGIDVPHITESELDQVMDGTVPSDEAFARLFHGMLPLYAPSLDEFDADAAADQIDDLHFHHETHNHVFSQVFPEMDYTDDLPEVTEPALVTVGRHDWITPVEASEEIADLLPNANLRIFEESGHNPHLDQSDSWLAEARAFLNRIGHR